jgi:hypothetical protein
MTDQGNAPGAGDPESPATGEAGPPTRPTDLESYIRANRTTFTEDALRREALAAGYAAADVDATLMATREVVPPVSGARAARNIFIAYLATYVLLVLGMLVNPAISSGSSFIDVRGLGIVILSMALGVGFVGSLIWIASRRGFFLVLGVVLAIYGVTSFRNDAFSGVVFAIGGGLLALVALRLRRGARAPSSPSMEVLMSMPLLILVAVGGTCLVSGLPIPRPV